MSTMVCSETTTGAVALYVHIPYCIHKCSYCDFYSVGVGHGAAIPGEAYLRRVREELRVQVGALGLQGCMLCSVFFGGGTPSMVVAHALGGLLEELPRYFALPRDLEVTCEANPETVDGAMLRALRAVGITRLSVGVQSFQPQHLQFMERIHSPQRAIQAICDAQAAGFTNLNLDLIFGLPSQTMAELEDDLAQALRLETSHISAYQLTVEPNTPLAVRVQRGAVVPIDDDHSHTMWQQVRACLTTAGLTPYEVSNYARTGFACVHNQHYWRSGEYLGLGAGSVSCVGHRRWRRARQLPQYLAGELRCDETEELSPAVQRFEYLMLALRTTTGFSLTDFTTRFGLSFDDCHPGLRQLWITAGYICNGPVVRCTERGLALLDSLLGPMCPTLTTPTPAANPQPL